MKTRTGKDGSGRYYIVNESGLALPSVTTIISETSDKSGLDSWVNRVGQTEADRISKFSANRGTFMHTLHEKYLDSLIVNKDDKPLQKAMIESLAVHKEEFTKESFKGITISNTFTFLFLKD